MNYAATTNSDNIWDWNFPLPQPNQDSDLLKQLNFIPGLKEIPMLRQVHALEHGTVWILSETPADVLDTASNHDNETLGGLSTEQGFYLYGQIKIPRLKRAVHKALRRFRQGEWDLAIHPRCGTNLSVTMMLTFSLALGNYLLLPRGPVEQTIGLGLAALTANQLAPDLGSLVQKYITTAIPFNLEIVEISRTPDMWGRPAHFVRLKWRDLQ